MEGRLVLAEWSHISVVPSTKLRQGPRATQLQVLALASKRMRTGPMGSACRMFCSQASRECYK